MLMLCFEWNVSPFQCGHIFLQVLSIQQLRLDKIQRTGVCFVDRTSYTLYASRLSMLCDKVHQSLSCHQQPVLKGVLSSAFPWPSYESSKFWVEALCKLFWWSILSQKHTPLHHWHRNPMVWKSCSAVYFLRDLWVQHHVFASFVPSVLFVNCMQLLCHLAVFSLRVFSIPLPSSKRSRRIPKGKAFTSPRTFRFMDIVWYPDGWFLFLVFAGSINIASPSIWH